MRVLAIDPGPVESAYVVYDGSVLEFNKLPNDKMLGTLATQYLSSMNDCLVVEMIESFGMSVGKEVFETVWWTGRFCQLGEPFHRVYRKEVKMHLCKSMRAKDANIRQALIDRFGPGKEKAIGKKKSPGPLYGLSGDCWSALAVAVTFCDTRSA